MQLEEGSYQGIASAMPKERETWRALATAWRAEWPRLKPADICRLMRHAWHALIRIVLQTEFLHHWQID
jgi:hypothetical protein